jgi:hypothetical protein
VSYKKQKLLIFSEHLGSPSVLVWVRTTHIFSFLFCVCVFFVLFFYLFILFLLLIFSSFCVLSPMLPVSLEFAPDFKKWAHVLHVVLLCISMFLVPCYDAFYNIRIQRMFLLYVRTDSITTC